SQTKLRSLHSDHSLQNQLLPAQIPVTDMMPQDKDALPIDKLTTPSTSIPDIDTQKYGHIPLSQHLEQQTTRLFSLIDTARQQITVRLGSNNISTKGNNTLIESAK